MKILHKFQKLIGYYILAVFWHNFYADLKRNDKWDGHPYMNHVPGEDVVFKHKCPLLVKIDHILGRKHVGVWFNKDEFNTGTGYWILNGKKLEPNEIKQHFIVA